MDTQRQFPSVHYICGGGISFVYEVHPLIVVKVPKLGEFEKQQFRKECFFFSENGIFLEYMRENHGEKLEPLPLRMAWMNNITQAVAFLESLGLAHGNLQPENILPNHDRLKLSDSDCTAKIRTNYKACMAPYGKILNSDNSEAGQGDSGAFGSPGPRMTEQFALGSIYYLMNYGFEVYGDRCLTNDSYEHEPKVVDLLQNMEFPRLNGNLEIDEIINKCWHNQDAMVSDLAAYTKKLLQESTDMAGDSELRGRIHGLWCSLGARWTFVLRSTNGVITMGRAIGDSSDTFAYKKGFCQDIEKWGLPRALAPGEHEEIGFTFDWYRHSL
ncbi:hypothetical protein BJX66DRAFT_351692 [Aspergillus keveii]|uniref:Protein kinase domain-containing protein n=1 Tax=Aspergillus keveii TaxID=714993 RepID=A0ABR4G3E6_9EURO